ncbi:MAG: PilZ domain-containing protein [Desulfotignum sp.]|nr:PilZ domain-containing protein [Desulfobacteraceae bacterium]
MTVLHHDDRRRHTRVVFATDIQIILEIDDKQVTLEGSSKDLSLKGIFVTTDKPFAPGTRCVVKIRLTGTSEKIELVMKATVARQARNGIGIIFDSMDVETYSHLKNIVRYNQVENIG